MHPNPSFRWTDEAEMLAFVAREAFASILVGGPAVVHAPLTVAGRNISFHLARRNRGVGAIDGSRVIASVLGRQGYQSANWYNSDDQVPTWLYEVVEIEGVARQLEPEELVAQLDALSNAMEQIHSPARIWTRAKMTPGKFEAMLNAIIGFTIEVEEIRGTSKFNQHKADADVEAMIAGQTAAGRDDLVAAIREKRP
ncbi:MAG: FMN-binding negative transcriptional regulator [Sphingomicrobium sp.]